MENNSGHTNHDIRPEETWDYIRLTDDGLSHEEALDEIARRDRLRSVDQQIHQQDFDRWYELNTLALLGLNTDQFNPLLN